MEEIQSLQEQPKTEDTKVTEDVPQEPELVSESEDQQNENRESQDIPEILEKIASAKKVRMSEQKAPKNKVTQKAVSFDSQMSSEKGIINLFMLFSEHYEAACNDDTLISDMFSVRDLRMIVRILNICDSQEIFSQRKPALVTMLRTFMSTPSVVQKFNEFKEKEEKKILKEEKIKEKPKPIQTRKSLRASRTVSNDNSTDEMDETEVVRQERKSDQNSFKDGYKSTLLSLRPMTLNDSIHALETLKKFNKIVWDISSRVSELERAVSNLLIRVAEAERLYS